MYALCYFILFILFIIKRYIIEKLVIYEKEKKKDEGEREKKREKLRGINSKYYS